MPARSFTSITPTISTRALRSAPSICETVWLTWKQARALLPIPFLSVSMKNALTKRGHCFGRLSWLRGDCEKARIHHGDTEHTEKENWFPPCALCLLGESLGI